MKLEKFSVVIQPIQPSKSTHEKLKQQLEDLRKSNRQLQKQNKQNNENVLILANRIDNLQNELLKRLATLRLK